MGLFVNQNDTRSQLQHKVAADLSQRIKAAELDGEPKKPAPAILDDQKTTTSLAWVWLLIGVVVAAVVIVFMAALR